MLSISVLLRKKLHHGSAGRPRPGRRRPAGGRLDLAQLGGRHARIGFRAVGEDAHEEHQHDQAGAAQDVEHGAPAAGQAQQPHRHRRGQQRAQRRAEQAEADHEAALAWRGPVGDGLVDDGVRRPFVRAEQDADGGEAGQRRAAQEGQAEVAGPGVAISNTDQVTPATIQTLRGP